MRNYRCWILDQNAHLMQRMSVDRFAAARVNGGMAWYEARTKCIFCRREKECVDWLESPEDAGDPRRFCPNVEFFMRCTQRGVSDYSGMAA